MPNGRLRNFCFTLNHPTTEDIQRVQALDCSYLIYGKEIGDSGTLHLQGYCELGKQVRFNTIKAQIPRAHIEKRRGTAKQASDYCRKEDKHPYIKGTISRPGTRTDIAQLYTDVKEGKTDYELQESNPSAYCRYYRGLTRMRFNHQRHQHRKFQPVDVTVYYGAAGTGKTRKVYEEHPDVFSLAQTSGQIWWDGYEGQDTILIDDFYGWIKYGTLLKLLDGYPFSLQTKGGHTWKAWKRVYITSNNHPSDWYKMGLTPALQRRLKKILYFSESGSEVGASITPNL